MLCTFADLPVIRAQDHANLLCMGPISVYVVPAPALSVSIDCYIQPWAGFPLFVFKYSHSIKILVGWEILPYVYLKKFFACLFFIVDIRCKIH